jgi:signal transduction histidine kinase
MVALLLGAVGLQTGRVVRRDRRLRESNAALSSANRELFQANQDLRREIAERRRAEEERARLDERLQQFRYLYRLRSSLGDARSPEEAIRRAGEALVEVLPSAGALIQYKGRTWEFGDDFGFGILDFGLEASKGSNRKSEIQNLKLGGVRYDRGLFWGGRERGRLILFCDVALSESQERTLLDETAGRIASVMEARELETQILHSSRLVSLGQMAAGVAHELSQPLSAISATAEGLFLRLEEGIAVSRRRMMEMMENVMGLVERMIGTIEHLRVFSRDTSGEAGVRFFVNEAVRSSLGLVGAQLRSHGVTLHLDLGEGLPPVWGNPHQMEQVFLNLLNNARDALDEKEKERAGEWGSGRVGAGPHPPPDLQKSLKPPPSPVRTGEGGGLGVGEGLIPDPRSQGGGWEKLLWIRTRRETYGGDRWVVAEVEDNGVGMDEAHRARLFEPFFTTKPADRGTGIGLSICQAIVQRHGGWIACESRKGEGTTFRVGLPAAEEK